MADNPHRVSFRAGLREDSRWGVVGGGSGCGSRGWFLVSAVLPLLWASFSPLLNDPGTWCLLERSLLPPQFWGDVSERPRQDSRRCPGWCVSLAQQER